MLFKSWFAFKGENPTPIKKQKQNKKTPSRPSVIPLSENENISYSSVLMNSPKKFIKRSENKRTKGRRQLDRQFIN